jgi:hypothetical protein
MNKLTREDIQLNDQYARERENTRKTIIALKKLRRVEVGDRLTFTFENRETIRYQIQEMMRIEHISDEQKIQFELDVYNELIPERDTLSATMFIEIQDQDKIKTFLDQFQGLDQSNTVVLRVNGEESPARFEEGHSKEDRISAVHYVKFHLNDNQKKNFRNGDVVLEVRHPSYNAGAKLTPEQKQEIGKDLES